MKDSGKTCAFTGYRPQKLPWGFDESDMRCIDFKRRLRDAIHAMILAGYRHFISGAALGTDLWGAQFVLEFKRDFPEVTLEMAIPFEAQAERWNAEHRSLRSSILQAADQITTIRRFYTKDCMLERNRYMVQNADAVIAAYDGREGGTQMTVRLAWRQGIPVILLWPDKGAAGCAQKGVPASSGHLMSKPLAQAFLDRPIGAFQGERLWGQTEVAF